MKTFKLSLLMPVYSDIPKQFKSFQFGNIFVKWHSNYFIAGIDQILIPNVGIDPDIAMRHLKCIHNSRWRKLNHKSAAIAYLASLWFEEPKKTHQV